MATTKITSNVMAANAAQNNINSGLAFNVNIPTVVNSTLNIDSGTLYVDSANNRVGIGTTTPSALLDVANTIRCNGIVNVNNNQIAGNKSYQWDSRGSISSPQDGVFLLQNWATNGFSRLQFGGTTSSFPAIKRNSTEINIVLGDDSGLAPLRAGDVIFQSATIPIINGNTTFSNNIIGNGTNNTLPNQTLTGVSSIMTRALADARGGYWLIGYATAVQDVTDSATLTDSTFLTVDLPIGTWYVETRELVGSSAFATAGSRVFIIFTGTCTFAGVVMRASPANAEPLNSAPNWGGSSQPFDRHINNPTTSTYAERNGIVTVTAPGTLKVQFAQSVATPAQFARMHIGSYIRAHKVG